MKKFWLVLVSLLTAANLYASGATQGGSTGGGGGAPTDATYWMKTSNGGTSAENIPTAGNGVSVTYDTAPDPDTVTLAINPANTINWTAQQSIANALVFPQVSAATAGACAGNEGRVYFDSTSKTLKYCQDASAYVDAGGAPTTAAYLIIGPDDTTLTANRILTPGNGISGTDGGINAPYTLAVDPTATFTWSGQNTWTLALRAPDGTGAAPSYTFANDTNLGFLLGSNTLGYANAGGEKIRFLDTGINIGAATTGVLGFGSLSTPTTTIGSPASATVQLGADAATGVAQNLTASNGTGGVGGDLNLKAGDGSTVNAGGNINFYTAAASGALTNRWQVNPTGDLVPASTNLYRVGSTSLGVKGVYNIGGEQVAYIEKTGDYPIPSTLDDSILACNGATVTFTLPAANAVKGRRIGFINILGSNACTIARAGSDLINGSTSLTFNNQYDAIVLVSDGVSKWYKSCDSGSGSGCIGGGWQDDGDVGGLGVRLANVNDLVGIGTSTNLTETLNIVGNIGFSPADGTAPDSFIKRSSNDVFQFNKDATTGLDATLTAGNGTAGTGGDLNLAGGDGSTTNVGGSINLKTAAASATLVTRLTIPPSGITDDSTWIGDGTKMNLVAIPDCDDVTGNHLNYDTTTNVVSCGTSGGAGSSPWQTTSNVANLVTATDNVTVGSATNFAKLGVLGDSDEIQFNVKANATQGATTAPYYAVLEASDGTDLVEFKNGTNTTAQIQLASGNTANPAICFGCISGSAPFTAAANQNTGFFSNGTDVIGIAINGNPRFNFNTDPALTPVTDDQAFLGDSTHAYRGVYALAIQGTRTKALTASTATTVVSITVGTNSYEGGTLFYTVHANDATNQQARHGQINFAMVQKGANTEVCTLTAKDGTATLTQAADGSGAGAFSAGTLTYTWTSDATAADGQCSFQLNAVSSLTTTTFAIDYRVEIDSGNATITP